MSGIHTMYAFDAMYIAVARAYYLNEKWPRKAVRIFWSEEI